VQWIYHVSKSINHEFRHGLNITFKCSTTCWYMKMWKLWLTASKFVVNELILIITELSDLIYPLPIYDKFKKSLFDKSLRNPILKKHESNKDSTYLLYHKDLMTCSRNWITGSDYRSLDAGLPSSSWSNSYGN
jgi:hypothetical protein